MYTPTEIADNKISSGIGGTGNRLDKTKKVIYL